MWVPFQIAAKCMQDHDEPWGIIFGFVHFFEHPEDDGPYGIKEAVQEVAVFQEIIPQVFVHGKDKVAVFDEDHFKGHVSGPLHGILVATRRAEAALAAERDKFEVPAAWTAIHSTAVGRVTAVYHFFDIFHLTVTWVEGVFDFLVMVNKDLL